jgi:hypothetical protein
VLTSQKIENKLSIIKREFYTMSRVPKPKPPPTQENFKIEDLLKNNTSLEDMIVRI